MPPNNAQNGERRADMSEQNIYLCEICGKPIRLGKGNPHKHTVFVIPPLDDMPGKIFCWLSGSDKSAELGEIKESVMQKG